MARRPTDWRAGAPLLLALAAGCPAEQLGVEIPRRGGADAISQEDLRRDVWRLSEPSLGSRAPGGAGYEAGRTRIAQRLEEMHLTGAFKGRFEQPGGEAICGLRRGKGRGAAAVVALDDRETLAGGAIPVALMISLAKAGDTTTPPEQTWIYCAVDAAGGYPERAPAVERLALLGPIAGDELDFTEREIDGRRALVVRSAAGGPAPADPEGLHFERLADAAVAILERIERAP